MRVLTSGVKVVDGLFGARVCLLAVCVFVCSIDRYYSTDTNKQVYNGTTPGPVHPSNLSTLQRNSAVTIEFDFKHIAKENRAAALDVAKREARKKILKYLNHIKDETTTQDATTVAATTMIPLSTTTTQIPISPHRKRRRREIGGKFTEENERKRRRRGVSLSNDPFTEENVLFVINDPEIVDDGIFRFSIFIDNETSPLGDLSHLYLAGLDFANLDLGELLLKTARAVNESGDLKAAANAPVVKISRGLPDGSDPTIRPVTKDSMVDFRVWLPILLAIIILLIVFIIVCYWKAKHKKVRDVEHPKIMPKQDSKSSPSNGHPRILDDNDGWLVPYEQFDSEQKI